MFARMRATTATDSSESCRRRDLTVRMRAGCRMNPRIALANGRHVFCSCSVPPLLYAHGRLAQPGRHGAGHRLRCDCRALQGGMHIFGVLHRCVRLLGRDILTPVATVPHPAGGWLAGQSQQHNLYIWMTLLTQAGVSLGLASEVGATFEGWGRAFQTSVIAIVLINQARLAT